MLFKKVLLGVALPTLAAASIAGAGYSTWIFGNTASATGTGSVTSANNSVLTVDKSTFNIICDQPAENNSAAKGLYFTDGTSDISKITFTYSGSVSGTVAFTVKLDDASSKSGISTYLNTSTIGDWTVSDSSTTKSTKEVTLSSVLSYTSSVPTTYSEWEKLNNLAGFTLTISATFTASSN